MIPQVINVLVVILLATQCTNLSSNTVLTVEQQQQDYNVMVDMLKEACPSLSTYRDQNEISNHFDMTQKQMNEPASVLNFYLNIARTLSFFQDGHLQSYASNDFYASINQLEGFLPLQLKFLDGKIYVWKDLSNATGLNDGSEIVAINGKKSESILEDLFQLISSDADNEFFKFHKLNNEHRLYLAYYFNFPKEYIVQVKDVVEKVTLKGITGHAYSHLVKKNAQKKSNKPYHIEYHDAMATAILKFTTFGDREGEDQLRAIMEELVSQCHEKGITYLILDIRGNTGGFDGNAAIMYSYLTNAPFYSLKGRYLKTNHLPSLEYVLNKDIQETLKSVPMQQSREEYKLNMALDQLFQPNELNFSGSIYLLTDNTTFSTATLFTSIFYHSDRGMIIGRNTGGGYRGDSGGTVYLELPNSRINVFIPLVRNEYFFDRSKSWKTFEPDEKVESTVLDLLNDKDRVLDKVFEMIEKKHSGGK